MSGESAGSPPAQEVPFANLARTRLQSGLVIGDIGRWDNFDEIEERIIAQLRGDKRLPLGGYLDFEEPIVGDPVSKHLLPTRGFAGKIVGSVAFSPFDIEWFRERAPHPDAVSEDMTGLSVLYQGEVFSKQELVGQLACRAAYVRPYPLNAPRPKYSGKIRRIFELLPETIRMRQEVEAVKGASATRATQAEGERVRNPVSGGLPGLGRNRKS